ncbi:MAG: TipAS antibiotic-recognition domain-containing protein [Clostridia bacterium]|nr:TipAS antibiotic-recognition domain-containing protein [Clostridia bacterium]
MSETYVEEAKKRWGDTAAWREFEARSGSADGAADGLMKLFARLGELKDLPPESGEAQAAIANIQKYITGHYYECTDEIFAGLGDMYVSDGRFRKNIDKAGGVGTAEFAREAIRARCGKK